MPNEISQELLKNLVVDVVNEVLPLAKGRNEGDVINDIQNKINDLIPSKFTESEGWKVELLPLTYHEKGNVATINFRVIHDYKSGVTHYPYSIPLS